MADLDGRVALVTGASRGIGAETARTLARAGATVIVTDLSAPQELADEIGGHALKQDVTQEADWDAVMAFATDTAGGLDILVNNAGVFLMKALADITLDDWRRVHSVNVEGTFLGCRSAAPLIAERAAKWSGGGSIINLSSMAGLVGGAGASCYNASKGAVRLMTKGLAIELAPSRVRVNSVHPGVIDTAMGDAVVQGVSSVSGIEDSDSRALLDQLHPLGHLGHVSDVANAIAYLASDKAAFMTGSEMVMDGGLTAQ